MTDILAKMTSGWLARRQGESQRKAWEEAVAKDKDHPQREYQKSREALLGKDFGTNPAGGPVMECRPDDKAARRKERSALVEQSLQACPDEAATAARLRTNMDKVEEARLAKQVYLKYDPDAPDDLKNAPPGYTDATEEDLQKIGLTQDMLKPEGTDFRAAVYKKDPAVWGDDAKPPYSVVFRGSTTAQKDWDNNFAQNANQRSDYYKRAVEMGNAISGRGATDDVQLIGHSLGGGLASAAEGGSGCATTTFNSAGLHPSTVENYSKLADRMKADPAKIAAYRVDGEVVTAKQETGIASWFAHPAVGNKTDIPPADSALSAEDRHGMNEVIAAIEKQKTADEAALKACLATKA